MRNRLIDSISARFCIVALIVFSVGAQGCRRRETNHARPDLDGSQGPIQRANDARDGIEDAGSSGESPPEEEPERTLCVHQRRVDLGAPAHAERGGRGGFIRLGECTRVSVIEGDERWLRVAFPMNQERTEGWVSRRYLVSCSICEPVQDNAEAVDWPPQPRGLCESSGASGQERFEISEVVDRAEVGGGARGLPGVHVRVATYNVWELYDGQGEDRYLAGDAHGGSPRAQYGRRRAQFSRALRPLEIDVLLLQEVESAAVACELAKQAWPRSGWSCYATTSRGGFLPQNLAIATRLKGTPRRLRSSNRRQTGPRDVLELSLAGAGGLTVSTVHLKSSRGQSSHEDCGNARRRMGAAAALVQRYEGWSSVLIAGDFNMDPMDSGSAPYDRTDDVLQEKGFQRLCPTKGCEISTYPRASRGAKAQLPTSGSAIDLAFYRSGGVWTTEGVEVVRNAPHRSTNTLGSDHLPVVITLRR